MIPFAARDALSSNVKRVSGHDRAGTDQASVFAVFESEELDAGLIGLVTLAQTARFSQRIFADLLPREHGEPVQEDADLETVAHHMEAAPASALQVLDPKGHLVGAVTRESLWTAMLEQQRLLVVELTERETQQRAMLDALPDELLCVSSDGRLLPLRHPEPTASGDGSSNGDGVPQGHLALEDSGGKRIADVFPADVAATLREGVRTSLASGAQGQGLFSIPRDEGVWQYEARFVPWGKGNVLIICRDVTEVNAMRAKLVTSDRLVSIGTLAAGVAHEINNPLTYISTNLALLTELIASRSPHDEHFDEEAIPLLQDMRDGVDRVRRTVGDLKLFSRSDEPARVPVVLESVLRRVIRIASNEIRHRATLRTDFGVVPPVDANDSQLGQVFLNLLMNAAQSIAEGAADRNEIRVVLRTDARGRAMVEVHDTGSGIPESIRSRIFAPFFTTKEIGLGTGLGLSICHGIVEAHGGQIEVESTVGKGSIFRVVLPASTARVVIAPEPQVSVSTPLAVRRPTGRFLVVDDEAAILRAYTRLLGVEQCVVCQSGREALTLLRRGETFDAILCDLMMPETSGIDVYAETVRIAPDQAARTIFVTGGAFTETARLFLAAHPHATLQKPFDSKHLFACLTEMIHQPQIAHSPPHTPQPT